MGRAASAAGRFLPDREEAGAVFGRIARKPAPHGATMHQAGVDEKDRGSIRMKLHPSNPPSAVVVPQHPAGL